MKCIDINSPEYRGAPSPKFDPLKFNETEFEDELRCKEYHAELADDGMSGEVKILSQESNQFSKRLEAEIIRAFRSNGAKVGCKIRYKFGQRDYGFELEGTLEIT